jgi:membrane protease YdiL (CAAX protease family)
MSHHDPTTRKPEQGWSLVLVLTVLAAALVVDHAVSGTHVALGLGLAACLLVIARTQGLAAADLGLARSTWLSGLRWGAAAATVVGVAYALAYLVTPVRQALPESAGGIGRSVLWPVLVVIPLGTVLPEELAFRGLLLALLGRRYGLLPGIWPRACSACGTSLPRLAAVPPTPPWSTWWGVMSPGQWRGSSSRCCSRR